MLTRAIIKGDYVLCGKCLSKLAIIKQTFKCKAYEELIPPIIEIKCKTRKNGVNCEEINVIEF